MKYRAHVAKQCVLKADEKMKSLYEGLYRQKKKPFSSEIIQTTRIAVKNIFAR